MTAQCWNPYCCSELDWTAGLPTPYLGSQSSKIWGKRKHLPLTTNMLIYALRSIRGYQKHYWKLSSVSVFSIALSNPIIIQQNFYCLVISTLLSGRTRNSVFSLLIVYISSLGVAGAHFIAQTCGWDTDFSYPATHPRALRIVGRNECTVVSHAGLIKDTNNTLDAWVGFAFSNQRYIPDLVTHVPNKTGLILLLEVRRGGIQHSPTQHCAVRP